MSALHVEDSGSGDLVILIHSSGLSSRQWRRLSADLVAHGMRVVAPDLTGHGQSEPWPEPVPFSFTTDVERVAEIARTLPAAHVIGHSYGGLVALHVARAVPLRSLVVFDPVAFGVLDPVRDGDVRSAVYDLDLAWGPEPADRERWLRSFVDFWNGDGAWDALREDIRAEFRRVAWVVREAVRTLMEDQTPATAFAHLAMPVHLFTGEHSPAPAKRVVERLAQAIPHAQRATVPRVGHLGPVTDPDAVNPALVAALLGRVSR